LKSTRMLTLGPHNEPLWLQRYIYPIHDRWFATPVADGVAPPGPDEVQGVGFFGETADEAERRAKAYLGWSEPVNGRSNQEPPAKHIPSAWQSRRRYARVGSVGACSRSWR